MSITATGSAAAFMDALGIPKTDLSLLHEQCIRAINRGDLYGWPPMLVEHCRKIIAERTILDLEARRNDDGSYSVAA